MEPVGSERSWISIDDSNGVLLPNISVVVTVVTQEVRNALTVPREALHIEGGRDYVYVVTGDTLRRALVSVGALTSRRCRFSAA